MADDQQIAMPMDVENDCSTEQPPNSNVVACPEQPSNDDVVASPPEEEAGPSSTANGLDKTNKYEKGFIVKKEIKQENKDSILVKGPDGFDRGLEPDRIVGAADWNGKLMFYLAWKNSNETDLIEASEIYENCPELAIEYYEAHLVYYPHAIRH